VPYHNFIGIDIGKLEFVVGFNNKTSSFSNEAEGWNRFVDEYESLLLEALIVLESTGGYERALLSFLVARGLAVHRADSRKVKNFIRSFGKYAKTDAIYALALANYGKERSSTLGLYCPVDESQETLRLLTERRMDLTQMLTLEKNRAKAPLNKPLLSSINVVIACLEKQLSEVGELIEDLILKNQELSKKKKILISITGCWPQDR
jgi:transposase